jgi:hypothetical protein
VFEWLGAAGTTVQPGAREVNLAHFGILLPAGTQTIGIALLTLVAVGAVVWLALRNREDFRAAVAVLIAGGVLAAPHALPTDLVIVAVALAVWNRAAWYDWLLLSVGAAVAALLPAPVPAVTGLLVIGWLLLRAGGVISLQRRPAESGRREQIRRS